MCVGKDCAALRLNKLGCKQSAHRIAQLKALRQIIERQFGLARQTLFDQKAAKDAGKDIKIGRFNFAGNGKAIALGEPEGMVKTIFDKKTGQLLGAHMVGAEVTELIQGFVVAMNLETTEQDLIDAVFPHPTLSEMMHESVMDAEGRVIHA